MIRVLIADDHTIVRKGLKQLLLLDYPDAEIGDAEDEANLLTAVMNQQWDVVLCDISSWGSSGLDVLHKIRHVAHGLPVLILNLYQDKDYEQQALKAGASAYLGKETIHEDLVKAIRTVLSIK